MRLPLITWDHVRWEEVDKESTHIRKTPGRIPCPGLSKGSHSLLTLPPVVEVRKWDGVSVLGASPSISRTAFGVRFEHGLMSTLRAWRATRRHEFVMLLYNGPRCTGTWHRDLYRTCSMTSISTPRLFLVTDSTSDLICDPRSLSSLLKF